MLLDQNPIPDQLKKQSKTKQEKNFEWWIKPLGTQGGYLKLPPCKELWEGRGLIDMSSISLNSLNCNECYL